MSYTPISKKIGTTDSSISIPLSLAVPQYTAVKLLHTFAPIKSERSQTCIKPATQAVSLAKILTKQVYANTLKS